MLSINFNGEEVIENLYNKAADLQAAIMATEAEAVVLGREIYQDHIKDSLGDNAKYATVNIVGSKLVVDTQGDWVEEVYKEDLVAGRLKAASAMENYIKDRLRQHGFTTI